MSDSPASRSEGSGSGSGSGSDLTGAPSAVLADDHEIVLHGLRDLLAGLGIVVAAEATNGLSAIAAIKRHRPQLALIDLHLPRANGIEVHAEARRWSPDTRFVVLTGSATQGMLAELLCTGVHGLFLKSGAPAELSAALPRIIAGETVISAAVREAVAPAEAAGLTRRELQVLQAIGGGASSAQISRNLGISAKTVENHRASMMRKLQVHSTASLIMSAIRRGLLSPDT
ncbi:MAG: response regulator transcription factor [Pseudomonadota bacterium]